MELARAYEYQGKILHSITPDIETTATHAGTEEDAADDPAIWVNTTDISSSLIYGSNKKGGLAVYNLSGMEVGYYTLGNINNVDILYDFPSGDSLITVLGCSNRSNQSIDLLRIDTDGTLVNIADGSLQVDTSLIDDIYGFCFARDTNSGSSYCVINGKNGLLQQYEMISTTNGIKMEIRRSLQFDSQTEGMVADNDYGFLYVGEEAGGVWKLNISPNDTSKKLISKSDSTNSQIVYDIEGMSLYKKGEEGFLVVSSQGNFSYAVFERTGENEYIGSFKVEGADLIDGVEETDGLDIISDSISSDFPKGMIVMQDGFNYQGDSLKPQNFKYIDWRKLEDFLGKSGASKER